MTRRDFFRLGGGRTRTLDVSCQRLYMAFVEATMDGSAAVAALIGRLQTGAAGAHRLRLRDTAWLAREEFRTVLTPLVDDFRARGGTVEILSPAEPLGPPRVSS